jgi:hypothetical protein
LILNRDAATVKIKPFHISLHPLTFGYCAFLFVPATILPQKIRVKRYMIAMLDAMPTDDGNAKVVVLVTVRAAASSLDEVWYRLEAMSPRQALCKRTGLNPIDLLQRNHVQSCVPFDLFCDVMKEHLFVPLPVPFNLHVTTSMLPSSAFLNWPPLMFQVINFNSTLGGPPPAELVVWALQTGKLPRMVMVSNTTIRLN